MQYLQAAHTLKQLIRHVNHLQTQKEPSVRSHCNSLFLFSHGKPFVELEMTSFTNKFVELALEKYPETEALVMTDMAKMMVRERELTYWLYKAYHAGLEKGMVYYQPIDENSLSKIGNLQFSNLEANIFFKPDIPETEESSVNALEGESPEEGVKLIVFLVGHANEERLLYDIQRLIFDSVSNVQNHKGLKFHFVLNISKFREKPGDIFIHKLQTIQDYVPEFLTTDYPNVTISFELEHS